MPEPERPQVDVDPRITFAAERTMLSWLRTGLALMGFGFVIARFAVMVSELGPLRDGQPPPTGSAGVIGAALVATGLLVNVTASVRHVGVMRRLSRGETIYPRARTPVIIGALTALAGLALLVLLASALA